MLGPRRTFSLAVSSDRRQGSVSRALRTFFVLPAALGRAANRPKTERFEFLLLIVLIAYVIGA